MRPLRQACVVLISLLTIHAIAQVRSIGNSRPNPRATFGTISMAATPSAVNIALVSKGVSAPSVPIAVTTTWDGLSLLSTINVYAFFGSSTSALSSGATSIPSANVLGKDTTGIPTSYTPFSQGGPTPGASLQLYSVFILIGVGHDSHTDNLTLEIDLTSLPSLPAGTYTGVLLLQAQAF